MPKLDKKYGFCYTEYTNAYEYDCHGQLTGEAFTDADGKINITEITYDTAGNIRTKGGKLYEYDETWKDLLVKYDGKNIYYDALGNPTTYLGNVLSWTVGRKLESFGDTISYKYNSLGHRITKTVGDTVHEYFYEGNHLIKEVRTDANGTVHTLVFLYDASDSPIGMQYDGTAYYYKKNLQGDVIALLDADCKTIAEYIYDAWGALRTINADTLQNTLIAALNPIRYRGYYYDNETGFYFLQSRYYDPVVGRFLNADETMFLGISGTVCGYNLFAYCENDPVANSDWSGDISFNGIKQAIKNIVDNIRSFISNFINYIKKQFQKFISKVSCHFNNGYLSIPTTPIGYLIDAVISTITGLVKGALLKGGFTLAKMYFKANLPKFKVFFVQTVVPLLLNLDGLLNSFIKYIAQRFVTQSVLTVTKAKIEDHFLGKYDVYKWISAFSSAGSFIATVLDILDGKWDNCLSL